MNKSIRRANSRQPAKPLLFRETGNPCKEHDYWTRVKFLTYA